MSRYKQELRSRIRTAKQAMTPQDIASRSEALCRMVLDTDAYRHAQTLYGYLPFNQEVDLLWLLRQALADGKQVALPKCYGKEMRFVLISDPAQVRPSSFGAPEPIADAPIADDKAALVLVPGLAFDRRGYRIGYGGGYYDRFLSREPDHPTIALCFDFQYFPRLEAEDHDIPVNLVLYK